MTRPRYLDRIGIDKHDAPVIAFLFGCALAACLVLGCELPPGPIVPVPDPINPPGPVVVVPPVTQGKRIALIIHESHEQTPEFTRMVVDLQAGKASEYFAKHGHTVAILDIDAKDASDNPLPIIERLKPNIANKTLPVLIVADKTKEGRIGNVLSCDSIETPPKGSDVIASVEKSGGGK